VIRQLGLFVVVALVFWLALAILSRTLWGDTSAVYFTVALAICVIPGLLTLTWSLWARGGPPEQQAMAVLGGTGIRLVVISVLALLLYQRVDYFRQQAGFMEWVLVSYLFTLALEIAFLLAGKPAAAVPATGNTVRDGSGTQA
jgi:hypothetical protein